jgi:hypothetical protein
MVMSAVRSLEARWLVAVVLAALSGGCTADTTVSVPSDRGGAGYPGTPSGGVLSGASTKPMVVVIDPNRTMTAQPGQGVGVFTEYAAGGHWHVWWTCDTAVTGLGCSFDVTLAVASGTLTNVAGEALAQSDQLVQATANQVEVVTQTSTGVSGVAFDTPAGVSMTLDAKMNGLSDGALLFFVQDGRVNGGYTGVLTDPLIFEPAGA